MAHGFLQSFDKNLSVHSAGTNASGKLNETAVLVMQEVGIDISNHSSDCIDKYLNDEWDYVITVCDHANETCPVFPGKVRHRLHIGFEDPSETKGNYTEVINEFYRIRNDIRDEFYRLYETELRKKL